jgi:hypothetical protein
MGGSTQRMADHTSAIGIRAGLGGFLHPNEILPGPGNMQQRQEWRE